jgi:hypothetical protein
MPYLLHPQAITPHDDTVIWRYMDLPKFLIMLEQKALYFALLGELDDKWEAVIDRRMARSIASTFAPSASGDVISLYQEFNKHMAVNCWYCGCEESIAMWTLYTETVYGVAIKSTVHRLKRALAGAKEDVFLGIVEYRDYNEVSPGLYDRHEVTPLKVILQKRVCYKHECELRAFTHIQPPFPDDAQPGQSFIYPPPEHGTLIDVDPNELIESIMLGPKFPEWALRLLKSAISRAGISPQICESDAFKAPPSTFITD